MRWKMHISASKIPAYYLCGYFCTKILSVTIFLERKECTKVVNKYCQRVFYPENPIKKKVQISVSINFSVLSLWVFWFQKLKCKIFSQTKHIFGSWLNFRPAIININKHRNGWVKLNYPRQHQVTPSNYTHVYVQIQVKIRNQTNHQHWCRFEN